MQINLFQLEEIAVLLLLIATLVGIAARRLRVPYTVGLVLVGTGLTFFSQLRQPARVYLNQSIEEDHQNE